MVPADVNVRYLDFMVFRISRDFIPKINNTLVSRMMWEYTCNYYRSTVFRKLFTFFAMFSQVVCCVHDKDFGEYE